MQHKVVMPAFCRAVDVFGQLQEFFTLVHFPRAEAVVKQFYQGTDLGSIGCAGNAPLREKHEERNKEGQAALHGRINVEKYGRIPFISGAKKVGLLRDIAVHPHSPCSLQLVLSMSKNLRVPLFLSQSSRRPQRKKIKKTARALKLK